MDDRDVTRIAVQAAAALREQVGPPDQWEVRPMKMGAEDDDTAPVVLLIRFSREIDGRMFGWDEPVSPDALASSVAGVEGIIHLLAIRWKAKIALEQR